MKSVPRQRIHKIASLSTTWATLSSASGPYPPSGGVGSPGSSSATCLTGSSTIGSGPSRSGGDGRAGPPGDDGAVPGGWLGWPCGGGHGAPMLVSAPSARSPNARPTTGQEWRCPASRGIPWNRVQEGRRRGLEPKVRIELTAYALPRRTRRVPALRPEYKSALERHLVTARPCGGNGGGSKRDKRTKQVYAVYMNDSPWGEYHRQQILAESAANGGVVPSVRHLGALLGIHFNTAQQHIIRLERDGRVVRSGRHRVLALH